MHANPIVREREDGGKEILIKGYLNTSTRLVHCWKLPGSLGAFDETFLLLVYYPDGTRDTYLIPLAQRNDETKRYSFIYEHVLDGLSSNTDHEVLFWYGIT